MTVQTKECSACKQTRLITDFAIRREAPDGRRGTCLPCRNARRSDVDRAQARARYWADPETARATRRRYSDANLPKKREDQRQWRVENRDRINAHKRAEYAATIEVKRELRRKYFRDNRDKVNAAQRKAYAEKAVERRAYARKYRQADPIANWAARYRLRARRYGLEPLVSLTAREWDAVVAEHGGLCAYCVIAPWQTMDHRVPISRGGEHSRANVLPCCLKCNSAKGPKSEYEFRAYLRESAT